MEVGRLFQSLGARAAKAQSPLVFSLARGTANRFWLEDLSGGMVVYGLSSWDISAGAKPCKVL